MQPDQEVAAIVRDCFDGTEESVAKTVRRIGKALRASLKPARDPRQIDWIEEVKRGL